MRAQGNIGAYKLYHIPDYLLEDPNARYVSNKGSNSAPWDLSWDLTVNIAPPVTLYFWLLEIGRASCRERV